MQLLTGRNICIFFLPKEASFQLRREENVAYFIKVPVCQNICIFSWKRSIIATAPREKCSIFHTRLLKSQTSLRTVFSHGAVYHAHAKCADCREEKRSLSKSKQRNFWATNRELEYFAWILCIHWRETMTSRTRRILMMLNWRIYIAVCWLDSYAEGPRKWYNYYNFIQSLYFTNVNLLQ